jgi:helicase
MMAEIESLEAAIEFGIPDELWAGYQIRNRSDDLYIASLSLIFDSLRLEEVDERESELSAIAKTLVIFSRSAAANYLSGVERNLNLLYSSALYYLAGFSATASLLARSIKNSPEFLEEESFLRSFYPENWMKIEIWKGNYLSN